jgi:hypothetical protein
MLAIQRAPNDILVNFYYLIVSRPILWYLSAKESQSLRRCGAWQHASPPVTIGPLSTTASSTVFPEGSVDDDQQNDRYSNSKTLPLGV